MAGRVKTFRERIEDEFGEPFQSVLQGFADMGYGCDTTSRILGYNVSSFRRLLKRNAVSVQWPTASQRINARLRYPYPSELIDARRAAAPKYMHPDTGESMTATQWGAKLGISCTQFLRRVKAHGKSPRTFLPNMRKGV